MDRIDFSDLTNRQRDVLWEVAVGKQNKEIAEALCITESTVENHLRVIYRKLGVTNRTEAVICAFRAGCQDQGNPSCRLMFPPR
jgi:DNA-binding NarL/FixJ family response regulator